MTRTNPRRRNESGFALLLVFAMAAAVAMMLYLEMPRVAFEYQRNKEGLLVERGEQYTRAIALYYRKFAKLPQNVDELENTNNLRFLRKKYEDPLTGKDEWRLVHVDAAGQYVDSLVHKRQGQGENKGPSVLAATIQGIGSQAEYTPGLGGDQDKNPALQRRASDRISPGTPGAAGVPDGESGDNPGSPEGRSGPGGPSNSPFEGLPNPALGSNDPNAPPTPGGTQAGRVGPVPVPGQPGQGQPGQTAEPGQPQTGQGNTGQTAPGQPAGGTPSQPSGGGFGFGGGGGFGSSTPPPSPGNPVTPRPGAGTQPGGPGFGPANPFTQGQQRPGGVPDSTMRAIGNMITGQQQRPGTGGGATGTGGLGGSLPGAGGTGGLVGVASKADFTGILVYNEKTNVKEWEFLFDMKKAAQAAANQQGQGNPQGPNPAQPGGQGPRPSMGNPFGTATPPRPPGRP